MTVATKLPARCAIFASGRGSNALSILRFQKENPGIFEVPLLLTDKRDAPVLQKLDEFSVEFQCLPLDEYPKDENRREKHESDILGYLRKYKIEWIILAGYRRLLSQEFLDHFYCEERGHYKVFNIHPSLLPDYPGLDSYEKAFEDGVEVSGVTVHFVDTGMDSGPILAQKTFPRFEGDSLETFKERGLSIEHQVYPQVLKNVFLGEYEINKKGKGSEL